MISAWTSHLDEKDKENFEGHVKRSKEVLDRLNDLLKQELSNQEVTEFSVKAFETPNWAERQAFYNGFRAALNTVTKITTDPKKDKQ